MARSNQSADGWQCTTATRQIAAGEEIVTSYMPDVRATSAAERRFILLKQKDFVCECRRCITPDDCRVMRCDGQGCIGFTRVLDCAWRCDLCGTTGMSDARLAAEAAIRKEYIRVEDVLGYRGDASLGRGAAIVCKTTLEHVITLREHLMQCTDQTGGSCIALQNMVIHDHHTWVTFCR